MTARDSKFNVSSKLPGKLRRTVSLSLRLSPLSPSEELSVSRLLLLSSSGRVLFFDFFLPRNLTGDPFFCGRG